MNAETSSLAPQSEVHYLTTASRSKNIAVASVITIVALAAIGLLVTGILGSTSTIVMSNVVNYSLLGTGGALAMADLGGLIVFIVFSCLNKKQKKIALADPRGNVSEEIHNPEHLSDQIKSADQIVCVSTQHLSKSKLEAKGIEYRTEYDNYPVRLENAHYTIYVTTEDWEPFMSSSDISPYRLKISINDKDLDRFIYISKPKYLIKCMDGEHKTLPLFSLPSLWKNKLYYVQNPKTRLDYLNTMPSYLSAEQRNQDQQEIEALEDKYGICSLDLETCEETQLIIPENYQNIYLIKCINNMLFLGYKSGFIEIRDLSNGELINSWQVEEGTPIEDIHMDQFGNITTICRRTNTSDFTWVEKKLGLDFVGQDYPYFFIVQTWRFIS